MLFNHILREDVCRLKVLQSFLASCNECICVIKTAMDQVDTFFATFSTSKTDGTKDTANLVKS